MTQAPLKPTLLLSLAPVLLLVGILILNVRFFGDSATSGPNQMALFAAALLTAAIGRTRLRHNYEDIEREAIQTITLAMKANLILLAVGVLIGMWIAAGIVPTLIYYGVKLISPGVFLPVACIACSIVALAIGSSWSTMGTIGVALIGVGETLGIPLPMVAGAIVSGAYFGDKLSPLSDTTNLAPAAAGTELFTHIRHMLYTTIPSHGLAIAGFAGLGLNYQGEAFDTSIVQNVLDTLDQHFNITPLALATPLAVFALVMLRVPAVPALILGILLAAVQAFLLQGPLLAALLDGQRGFAAVYTLLVETGANGFSIETGNAMVDQLLNKGGMLGMLNTVLLIIMALFFGGMMEATGMLQRLAEAILRLVRGPATLVAATVSTCTLFNLTASDQYLSIVIPGRMFRKAYENLRLEPRNLSRALEDGGTVTSVLVPWNTCGAFAASVLGVATFSYAPFAFFCILSPFVSIAMATMGLGMARLPESDAGPNSQAA